MQMKLPKINTVKILLAVAITMTAAGALLCLYMIAQGVILFGLSMQAERGTYAGNVLIMAAFILDALGLIGFWIILKVARQGRAVVKQYNVRKNDLKYMRPAATK